MHEPDLIELFAGPLDRLGVRKLKTAGVRSQHPDGSDSQVLAEVNRLLLHPDDLPMRDATDSTPPAAAR